MVVELVKIRSDLTLYGQAIQLILSIDLFQALRLGLEQWGEVIKRLGDWLAFA